MIVRHKFNGMVGRVIGHRLMTYYQTSAGVWIKENCEIVSVKLYHIIPGVDEYTVLDIKTYYSKFK